jgi:hypothetical protein
MDKVFITKEDLTKSINSQRKKSGPFITALVLFWLFVSCSIVFFIPSVVFGLILLNYLHTILFYRCLHT